MFNPAVMAGRGAARIIKTTVAVGWNSFKRNIQRIALPELKRMQLSSKKHCLTHAKSIFQKTYLSVFIGIYFSDIHLECLCINIFDNSSGFTATSLGAGISGKARAVAE